MEQLDAIKDKISEEDYKRARYVIGEEKRVLDVCEALEKGDYETVGKRMYETHWGMSKDYEVSCEELDFLAEVAEPRRAASRVRVSWAAASAAARSIL